jgi:hypothetical protein
MGRLSKRLLCVSIYAVAMALLEAVVVVYIRGLLTVTSDHVALGPYANIEIGREAATLVMLLTVGWLAGGRGAQRLAYAALAFGLWDISYYVWLRVLIGWPATLLDWDILFLIPLRWWGPVLSPLLIAALICTGAVLALVRMERGARLGFTPARTGAILLGGLFALAVFMADALRGWLMGHGAGGTLRPQTFHWPLFLVALALMALPGLLATWPRIEETTGSQ